MRDRQILKRLGRIQDCIAEAAAALGYASLWAEGYVLQQEDYARSVLEVPKSLRVLAVLPIGKPAERRLNPCQAGIAVVTPELMGDEKATYARHMPQERHRRGAFLRFHRSSESLLSRNDLDTA